MQDCAFANLCPQLQTLHLSHNLIHSLEGVETLTHLKELAVNDNNIESITQIRPLSTLPCLHWLEIKQNPCTVKMTTAKLRVTVRNMLPGEVSRYTHASFQSLSWPRSMVSKQGTYTLHGVQSR